MTGEWRPYRALERQRRVAGTGEARWQETQQAGSGVEACVPRARTGGVRTGAGPMLQDA